MATLTANLGAAQLVAIRGPDALRFAAGMFTSDVLALEVGGHQRSACCDAKGRLLGLMDLVRTGEEELTVVLEGRTAADFIGWYDRYLLMDDALLEDVSNGALVWSETAASDASLAYPRRRAGRDGFDHVVTGAPEVDAAAFEAERVAAGDPRWPVDMSDKQLVHELGLRDEVLTFGKGCYVGQETINRLDVRGGVKQRLVGLLLSGEATSGEPVLAGDKRVGVLRSCVEHPRFGWIGLCVVRMPHDEAGTELRVGMCTAVAAELPLS